MEKIKVELDFIMNRVIYKEMYDGHKDDLLTGGLGKTGLEQPEPDCLEFENPEHPTRAELRKRAIHKNYRAIVDMSPYYYGKLYGPVIDNEHKEGLIAGEEYLALTENRVTLMVQIPSNFDIKKPRIITAPSSGSRGIYGAIAAVGEWGLKNGFAVAYTDKGTGIGAHNLAKNSVNTIFGERKTVDSEGYPSNFIAPITKSKKNTTDSKDMKHSFAFKHAHSMVNPEKDWGKYVLYSIELALEILRIKYKDDGFDKSIKPLIIAAGISNGGNAAIRAAEQDSKRLISGLVVSEPNVCPEYDNSFGIVQGNQEPFFDHSKNILEYITLQDVYMPCACLLSDQINYLKIMFNLIKYKLEDPLELVKNRCRSLIEKGLLKEKILITKKNLNNEDIIEEDYSKIAREAQEKLHSFGLLPERNLLQPLHLQVIRAIAVTYANQYGCFSVTDNLCGYSFSAVDDDGKPVEINKKSEAKLYSDSNGIPSDPSIDGIKIINNNSADGPVEDIISKSISTGKKDMNLDGSLHLFALAGDNPQNLSKEDYLKHIKIRKGIKEVCATGNLNGLPAIIVHGRSDAVIAPNHSSRAYWGLNQKKESKKSKLYYYEITNAHHLDCLNFNQKQFIPLHYYYIQALDLMYNHLLNGTSLPESQVVRTNPSASVDELDIRLPEITTNPSSEDKIVFVKNGKKHLVKIPE